MVVTPTLGCAGSEQVKYVDLQALPTLLGLRRKVNLIHTYDNVHLQPPTKLSLKQDFSFAISTPGVKALQLLCTADSQTVAAVISFTMEIGQFFAHILQQPMFEKKTEIHQCVGLQPPTNSGSESTATTTHS